ncbi:MAG: VWA domain-containing protein [Thermoanaerobaculia bacterium]
MTRPISLVFLLALAGVAALADEPAPPQIGIEAEALGDRDAEVVARVKFALPSELPEEREIILQGSLLHEKKVVRNFRYTVRAATALVYAFVLSFPAGETEIDVRLLVMRDDGSPLVIARGAKTVVLSATGAPYVASAGDGAEAILAEGIVPESSGAVKIRPPRRDLAPNLFVVDVDVKPPVRKVEFWADGKKIFTKNAAPYRAELDLGGLPKRVEVRVVGYDARGNYIDADAWIVNERDNPIEAKLTRTTTPDGVSHFKLSIQNQKNVELKSVALFAGDRMLIEWKRPPYAFSIPTAKLAPADYVSATVVDVTGYEAADLLYLDGNRYIEQVDVNLVELPVSVFDAAGASIVDLKEGDFEVFEDGKQQKIANFGFSNNLPLSLGVLLDHSGSMQPRIEQARRAAVDFFEQIMRPGDRAFFGGFAWEASDLSPFVSDPSSIKLQVLDTPAPEGGTALYDAIVTALYRFRSVEGRKALVLVTDGEDTVSRIAYDDMLRYVRSARVPIYFIGIGMSAIDFTATGKLKGLAAETGAGAYFIKDVADLKTAYGNLEKDLRSQYLIGYYTESGKDDRKYRTVEVRAKRKDAKVRTIRGFLP